MTLNIGSGGFCLKGVLNLDLMAKHKSYKVVQGQPFIDYQPINLEDENTYMDILENRNHKFIYCSHTLEHLEKDTIKQLLKNLIETLPIGGVIRIALPSYKKWFNYAKIMNNNSVKSSSIFKKLKTVFYAPSLNLTDAQVKAVFDKSDNEFEFYNYLLKICSDSDISTVDLGPEGHKVMVSKELLKSIQSEGKYELFELGANISCTWIFKNKSLFDHTERNFSDYYEIIKVQ